MDLRTCKQQLPRNGSQVCVHIGGGGHLGDTAKFEPKMKSDYSCNPTASLGNNVCETLKGASDAASNTPNNGVDLCCRLGNSPWSV